jgi:quercetin dioxygenase-like cupin family protein
MPSSIIIPHSVPSEHPTQKATGTFTGGNFTGDVYANLIHGSKDHSVLIANVTFCPGARSHWHTHVGGGFLYILHGSGLICDKGAEPKRIVTGDAVWIEPGTTHWHGAEEQSIVTSLGVGFGETEWLDEVTDEEFAKGKQIGK